MARIHRLKVWTPYFEQVSHGLKTFEVRRDDRGYAEGDFLVLDECHKTGVYSKEPPIVRLVTYLLRGGQFGIADGYVVLGIDALAEKAAVRVILDVAPPRGDRPETAKP